MGRIIDSRLLANGKMLCKVEVAKEEVLQLKGNWQEVQFFSISERWQQSWVVETGIYNSTKYFVVPKMWRIKDPRRGRPKNFDEKVGLDVRCQVLNVDEGVAFIYVVRGT